MLVAGKTVVVAGYGWCGRGVAMRARGLGAHVIVTEVNPVRAIEALLDGFKVMRMDDAASLGDIFITTTGDVNVINASHFGRMKDGVILANAGHFNVEIDIPSLSEMAEEIKNVRDNIQEYRIGGKKIYLIAEGRLVNLAAGDGHPIEVMDMSFSNQALAVRYLVEHGNQLENRVYPMPSELDERVARLKLKACEIEIDELTEEQRRYLSGWEHGT